MNSFGMKTGCSRLPVLVSYYKNDNFKLLLSNFLSNNLPAFLLYFLKIKQKYKTSEYKMDHKINI